MKRINYIPLFLAVMLLLLPFSAYAQEGNDSFAQIGSITIQMNELESGKPVPGGTMRITCVAKPARSDGNDTWVYTEAFAGCGLSLDELSSASLAQGLADYAAAQQITGSDYEIGSDAKLVASQLPTGLYLIVQTVAAEGYLPVEPFLVSIPALVDGAYVYDVNASPKLELKPGQEPTEPTEPSEPPAPPELPHTGQSWYPVMLLAAFGLVLALFGTAILVRCKKK